jgi:serine/tyrosine/threonine adenylyltransferase
VTVTDQTDANVLPLDGLRFDHRFTRDLPGDTDTSPRRRQVEGAAFSRVAPTPVAAPRTIIWSPEVAALLGLSPDVCDSDDFAEVFGGSRVPAGADPFAMCYGGHQFGNWAGQLGDGRAIALGEVVDVNGSHQTLQLKGPGPTPYSRTADGRAVLRSSVREFLCSEAMFHLGVPTTRALSLVLTGDGVVRDMLYNGNPAVEPGAIVCRVAPSFVRFGSFQLPRSRHDLELLRQLTEFTINNDFPDIAASGVSFPHQAAALFDEACQRSLTLVIDWMRVGFVHGVLNTDNMSILGLTIDYGPYGWLEDFDDGWTPNTTDASGKRYRYGAQPTIFGWNLAQLANALAPLVEDIAPLQASLDQFVAQYFTDYLAMMVDRLGWNQVAAGDEALVQEFLSLLGRVETDYLILCRSLAQVPTSHEATDDELLAPLVDAWYSPETVVDDVRAAWVGWLRAWGRRAIEGGLSDDDRRTRMNSLNPKFVLRNYLAQEAIDAAEQGDESLIHELLDVLRHPYDDQPGRERFAARRPEWARHRVGCSMLSCSS